MTHALFNNNFPNQSLKDDGRPPDNRRAMRDFEAAGFLRTLFFVGRRPPARQLFRRVRPIWVEEFEAFIE